MFSFVSWGKLILLWTSLLALFFIKSHKFWVVVFSLLFVSMHILISFLISSWSIGHSVVCCLSSIYLCFLFFPVQFTSVIPLCLTMTSRTATHQISLSITNSPNFLKLMSIQSVMPFNHLILCHSLLLLPSIFPSIRVFFSESFLCIRWPKYWSFSVSISLTALWSERCLKWFHLKKNYRG